MTSKLTRERLAEIAQFGFSSAITPANDFEIKELARLALAAMNGEPVAEVCEDYAIRYISNGPAPKEGLRPGDKLYRHAQPALVVPEEITSAIEGLKQSLVDCNRYNYCFDAVTRVENACRAAMLAAAPQEVSHD
ncbi:TPA: hypothetical protein ACXP7K_001825 [Klebsiella quasipneumoniae subsp. quasipneumoniae]|uniref:hypothetical protein n=1 Tax=Klebsiella pneumoniae complex TaxID=3390273 RepID=UPI0006656FEC|nr:MULTISPECIES: hypothetical protein [Klebsiella]HBQ5923896.1 hypothetical protein [Klebsiella pneumoniae subsp. pneumoniae]EKW7157928.1 hypothetical protein [Klebsiella pneumoniae]MCP5768625.1 hypothetical protein [Klebsiella pneumoniae]PAB14332.1 hypothetical protein CDA28_23460 [Klebsiella pneumoniae]PAB24314.1 hypothetical protein CDA37_00215 [Klebsiella pneumoniae]